MQSRFCAFAVGAADYLLDTWHPSTRPAEVGFDGERQWRHLEIIEVTGGGLFDSIGTVEFRAHYRAQGRRGSLHERSNFVRINGRWLYRDGAIYP